MKFDRKMNNGGGGKCVNGGRKYSRMIRTAAVATKKKIEADNRV